jgi:transposase
VGIRVVSCDEKTGIQAVQRKHPTKPMCQGQVERREFEYVRHGTQCLIAGLDVATGQIVAPTVSATRTAADFAAHIAKTLDTDPTAEWVFVVDGLNTHQSEALVRLVAARCGVTDDLGVKGKTGVLRSMPSRRAFLESTDHRVRFVYTPKHCSWLNQIEIWFSILARRVLRRGSFASVEALKTRLLEFIEYFNRVLAKPFKWTYTGRPLTR